MKTKIYKTYSDFLNRSHKSENGVSVDFAEDNKKAMKDIERCALEESKLSTK